MTDKNHHSPDNEKISSGINRRQFISNALTGGLAAALISPLLFNTNCKSRNTIRIGYLPITDASPLLVAWANKYFSDEGVDVPRPTMIRNWSGLVEAFLAEKVDIVHLLLPIPIWMKFNKGHNIKVLAWDHTNGSALTVDKNSDITSFADLGGCHIAVPYWYSMHNVILQMGIRKHGLSPVIRSLGAKLADNEVNLSILPPSEMPIALAGGKIDGYIVAEPFNALAELRMGARIMRFTGDIWKNHPCCVIVAKESLITSEPVKTRKIINAIVRAQAWIRSNRTTAATLLSRNQSGLLPVSDNILNRVFNGYDPMQYNSAGFTAIKHPEWKCNRIDFQPYPYPSATGFIIENMKKTLVEGSAGFMESLNPINAAKQLIDDRFVKNALIDLGLTSTFVNQDSLTSPWSREEIIEF